MDDHSSPARVVLELRVHGVANTAPADMLGLTPADIQQVDGDALGSFWRPTSDALARTPKGSSGWVPDEVQREAYSWGGLARTTVTGGSGQIGTVVAALGRIGWTLLLPFGLTNVAYWTRPLTEPPGTPTGRGGSTPENGAARWEERRGQGAGTVRLFGLLLTLLIVTTACEVAIDLVGAQCYQGDQVRCTNLPSLVDVLKSWGVGPRLALFSAVPVLLLLGLWLLTRISSERYEAAAIGHGRVEVAGAADEATHGGPTKDGVTRPGTWFTEAAFWDGRSAVRRLTKVHIAAGLLVVTVSTAWPALVATDGRTKEANACRRVDDLFSQTCLEQVRSVPVSHWLTFSLIFALSVLALLVALVAVVRLSGDAPDLPRPGDRARKVPTYLLVTAILLLLAEVLALILFRPGIVPPSSNAPAAPSYLPGVVASPVLLTALLLGLATAGLALRTWRAWWCLCLGFVVSLALLLPVVVHGVPGAIALGVAVVLFLVVLVGRPRSTPTGLPQATMWGGRAPGVLMLLALAVAATLSSIVVLTAGDWLNGGRGASDLLSVRDPANGPLVCSPTSDQCRGPHLSVAAPYVWAGLVALAFVLLFAVAAVVLWAGRGGPVAAAPVDLGEPGHAFAGVSYREGGSVDALRKLEGWATSGTPDSTDLPSTLEASLLQQAVDARRTAAYTQRAEILVAVFAVLATLAVTGAVVLAVTVGSAPAITGWWAWVNRVLDGGVAVITLLGAAIVTAVAGGGSRGTRPLGLAWDLMCCLPRTGHPLGPPCYAERAVPEVVRRIEWWLDGRSPEGSVEPGTEQRRVVLSAHSLGAVLAVAAVCATTTRDEAADTLRRTSLITYGSQLRPYFGRLFPELIGPSVLGTAPVAAPRAWGADPWRKAVPTIDRTIGAGGLRSLVGGRWWNLWRLTDVIGFPVDTPRPAPGAEVDRAAEEFDTSTYVVSIDGHGDYPRSLTYLHVLDQAISQGKAALLPAARPSPQGAGRAESEHGSPGPKGSGVAAVIRRIFRRSR